MFRVQIIPPSAIEFKNKRNWSHPLRAFFFWVEIMINKPNKRLFISSLAKNKVPQDRFNTS